MLDCHSSLEVLEIARRFKGSIHIFLTDVVVAGLRGPELARNVAAGLHQGIQIIDMSGYAPEFLMARFRWMPGFRKKGISFCNAGGTA